MSSPGSLGDRELQDEIIRYLTDANVRAAENAQLLLSQADVSRAGQFSRFLARRYYRDRLHRAFRYSNLLAGQTGRCAEEVVDRAEFEAFLGRCVLGSLAASNEVGEFALAHLRSTDAPGPWWCHLLQYECAFFIQMATSEPAAHDAHPRWAASTSMRRFDWRMPELLARLRAQQPVTDDLRGPVTLLFSRTHQGRIYVVELDAAASAIMRLIDGKHLVEEITSAAGVTREEARRLLDRLSGIGAIEMPSA